eukprot:jgi/Orpsp1_1/1185460/evm.model.c7180000093869.2
MNDKSISLIKIPHNNIDPKIFDIEDFISNPNKYKDIYAIARIENNSNENEQYLLGRIIDKVTDEHTIESRTTIALKENNIKDNTFDDLVLKEIPSDDWIIPKEEIEQRY